MASGSVQPRQLRASSATPSDSEGKKRDEDDDVPAVDPEYGDLLDMDLLEHASEASERDDDLVDVGLTLDLSGDDDDDEVATVMDLDVGTLLTSLPVPVASRDDHDLGEEPLATGALRALLLPEEPGLRRRSEDDDEVGDDEQFPAFDETPALQPSSPPVDGETDGEA